MDLYRFYRYKVCIRKMMSYARTRKLVPPKSQTQKRDYIKEIGVETSLQARHQNISYLYHHGLLHIPTETRRKRNITGKIYASTSRDEPVPALGAIAKASEQIAGQLATSGSFMTPNFQDSGFFGHKAENHGTMVFEASQPVQERSVEEIESVTSNLNPIFRNSEIEMKEESISKVSDSISYFEN